ncbi:MAG: type VI secretion system baseplate subunit TssF, partial [Chthoniobacterales bacterium]|nr:type VI secretion system baseplate subunit TssF [Chthoniobacterales bacterium]
ETPPGIPFSHLKLDSLDFFLRGSDDVPTLLLEAILTAGKGFAFRSYSPTSTSNRSLSHEWIILPSDCVKPRGLDPSDALLPVHSVVFDGYRLLMEYFAFWKRFRFFSLTGFESVRFSDTNLLEIAIPVGEPNSRVRPYVNPSFFGLYCTPVINLFPKRCDRISLDPPQVEYHIVPDRTRPLEFEVYCVEKVIGYGKTASEQIEFLPFYHTRDTVEPTQAFYTLHRRARMLSEKEKKFGRLSSYLGSEVWISLVKISPANFRSRLQQLGIEVLCTNRHLPLFLTQGDYEGAFVCEISGPIQSIRCLAGPTPPRPSYATGEFAWRLLSHLTLNYQPLISGDMRRAVSFLQEMLMLYVDPTDKGMQKHIEGLLSVESQPIFRRISHPGIISYVRGREIRFTFDEDNFTGVGIFLIGMVLERFFRRYATVNSFVETILCSRQRGQIYRWPTSTGLLSPI